MKAGRHDPQVRRRTKRTGRERGCWAYIPAEVLESIGIDPAGDLLYYRTAGHRRSRNAASVIVSLYREP